MSTKILTTAGKTVVSKHPCANVFSDTATGQKSLHAAKAFQPGEIISPFRAGVTQSFATYLTVQTGPETHITLVPEFLQYINHSCEPNVFFDTTAMQLVCLKPIEAGEEFTFFYPSTEWEMAQPFVCNCGHPSCLQLINGASHLSAETLSRYRLTDFILGQANHKNSL